MIGAYRYLNGPYTASSSWVAAYGFIEELDQSRGLRAYFGRNRRQGLLIRFKDGAACFYPGTSQRQLKSLMSATSKGKWVHRNVFHLNYELLK